MNQQMLPERSSGRIWTEQGLRPGLCFVGPMLGGNKGWVVSQGEILAGLFAEEGYPVRLTSTIPNRSLRLADTLVSLVAWRKQIDAVLLAVFSGLAFGIADLASLVAKRLRKPVIYILRGGNLPEFTRRHPNWVHRVFSRSAALVSPSNFLAHFFQLWGKYEVRVIPNVLLIEQYPYRHRPQVRPCMLWMRTFEDAYHPELAVHVLKLVQESYPNATLTMAGQDRGLLKPVKDLARQLGLDENGPSASIRFPGFLDRNSKQREFSTHDIFLNTNRVDNMPISVVEAAAFGLPVVATAVGGIPYLLKNERTALLVEDLQAGETSSALPALVIRMAEAVKRLVREPELTARLSANGRLLAESCAWPVVKTQWEQLFSDIL